MKILRLLATQRTRHGRAAVVLLPFNTPASAKHLIPSVDILIDSLAVGRDAKRAQFGVKTAKRRAARPAIKPKDHGNFVFRFVLIGTGVGCEPMEGNDFAFAINTSNM